MDIQDKIAEVNMDFFIIAYFRIDSILKSYIKDDIHLSIKEDLDRV